MQHHVYTAIVGLTAVEAGTVHKPDDLDISWKANDPQGSARESRRFILRSTLVFVAEELSEYAKKVLQFLDQPVPADRSERLRALGPVEPSFLGLAAELVSHWRNRIVHRQSTSGPTARDRAQLVDAAPIIRADFKHLDITLLLGHFETDQPTLKDVTVLLAMAIRFARRVDGNLPTPTTPETVRSWLRALDLLDAVARLETQARNGGSSDPRQRARQLLLTRAPTLAAPYYEHGTP